MLSDFLDHQLVSEANQATVKFTVNVTVTLNTPKEGAVSAISNTVKSHELPTTSIPAQLSQLAHSSSSSMTKPTEITFFIIHIFFS